MGNKARLCLEEDLHGSDRMLHYDYGLWVLSPLWEETQEPAQSRRSVPLTLGVLVIEQSRAC